VHIADGVLATPVLVAATAVAAGGVAIGLRRMTPSDVPKTALMASTFFVASLIHVPVGVSSAHLLLPGLMGVILGWLAFPALLIALAMQLLLLGFGGVTTLGVNLLIFALPAMAAHAVARRTLGAQARHLPAVGAMVGAGGVAGAGLIAVTALAASGRDFLPAAGLLFAAHLPIIAIEGLVVAAALPTLHRLRPDLLAATQP